LNAANQQQATEQTMTTTMTGDQFAWKQFSLNHIEREGGAAHERRRRDDDYYHEENFDIPVTSSTRATATSKTTHRDNHYKPRKSDVQKFQQIAAQAAAATAAVAAALVEKTHEEVKKPKTRAERREIEPTEIDTPAAQTDKRPAKREQRSEYWVERDNKRRSAAITFKNQNQEN
jgi:hypothetical protein